MRFCISSLTVLFFGCAVATGFDPSRIDCDPVVSCLSPVKDKFTYENIRGFVKQTGGDGVLCRVENMLDGALWDEAYPDLAYEIGINSLLPYTGNPIFKNRSDGYVAQFLLAGVLILNKVRTLFVYALAELSIAMTRGKSAIQEYFGVDVGALQDGLRTIEEKNPDMYGAG